MLSKNKLKYIRLLKEKKYREAEGKFLIEGPKLVTEAAGSDFTIDLIAHTSQFAKDKQGRKLLDLLMGKNVEVREIHQKELEAISDTVTSQGIMGVVRKKLFHLDDVLSRTSREKMIVVALDRISDPGNLGTIIRTCDWFGVHTVLLSQDTVELYNPKVVRATMGSVFHLPILENVNLENELRRLRVEGFKVYVTDLAGDINYAEVDYAWKSVLVLGSEAGGVKDGVKQLADVRIKIQQGGQAESLNVAVACGIILAEMQK